jgi:hypothetical protein
MEIYDLRDAEGRAFAFEVENANLGRHGACRVADKIPGARVVRRQRRFAWSNRDDFCEFELDGITFVIEEPFGDNSRYWVGPKPPHYVPQIAVVRDVFARAGLLGLFMRAAG